LEDIPDLRDKMMMQVLPLLPAISSQFGLSYRPIEKFECQITSYCDGEYYKPHVDVVDVVDAESPAPNPPVQRLIFYTYYLHSTPKKFTGGALRFLQRDGTSEAEHPSCTIEPQNNRIVFFPSNILHEVTPVSMSGDDLEASRLSVNGWIRCHD